MLRDLRQTEIDLVLAILDLYAADFRFLIPPSGADRVGMVLNLLSAAVCNPMSDSLRSSTVDAFESVYRQTRLAEIQGTPIPAEALASLSSTASVIDPAPLQASVRTDLLSLGSRWRLAGNASHTVLENAFEDPEGIQDLAVLAKTFTLACEFSSSHPEVSPAH